MPRILIVEDEAALRMLEYDLLADEGYEVETAANGELGLAAVQAQVPDLLILDIRLPDMNAATFLERWDHPEVPVIILSGARELETIASDFGAIPLSKPFEVEALLALVKDCLPEP